jgi:hypothetical protein
MNIVTHNVDGTEIAEMQSRGIIIRSARDAMDIIGQLLGQHITKLILHERQLCPEFWQLSNGLAGEILQKFINYSVGVAFIGEFEKYKSKSLQALIHESNLGKQVNFLADIERAKARLSS